MSLRPGSHPTWWCTHKKNSYASASAAAKRAGKQFHDYMEMLFLPEQEVLLLLKNRSPSLSLHSEGREQILNKPIPSKMLFDADVPASVGDDPFKGETSFEQQQRT